DLAGRGEQETRAGALREAEELVSAHHVGEHRVLGVDLIERRRGWAGEVVDAGELADAPLDRARQRLDDVALDEFEAVVAFQHQNVRVARGLQVVEAHDAFAALEQLAAEIGTDEPRAARDERQPFGAVLHTVALLEAVAAPSRSAAARRSLSSCCARRSALWCASTAARAAAPMPAALGAGRSSAAITSAALSARTISRSGANTASMPSQRSDTIGVAQAPASNRRTEGDQPAAIMSARVTL